MASTANPIMLLAALTIAMAGIGARSSTFFQLPTAFLTGPTIAVRIAAIYATGTSAATEPRCTDQLMRSV
ncbi:hypothetical protein FXW78_22775 [Rhodococcus opacus]|nr:hypothetical protein [Rhodococcus opacus]